jgi:hypothetical protein
MKKVLFALLLCSSLFANETRVYIDALNNMNSDAVKIIKDYYGAMYCTNNFHSYTSVDDIRAFMSSQYFASSQSLITLGGFDNIQYQSRLQSLKNQCNH